MSRTSQVILTNMCLIEDGNGNIVMQIRDPKRYSWSGAALPGGHIEEHEGLVESVIREVKEETGIKKVCPVTEDIFSLESLTVDGHIKNGSYISSHLHLNITYLLEADSEETVSIKEDENSGVAWFAPEEALKKSSEPWFVAHIYKKMLDKMDETGRNVR